MKFTNGYWYMRQGITPYFPAQVHEVEVTADAMTVFAATKRLANRADTLNLPILTARFSSPVANVIKVELIHHKGVQLVKPQFELNAPGAAVVIHDDDQAASLTSGNLTVRVEKAGDWNVSFLDGEKLITYSGWRGMGIIRTAQENYIHEQLTLGVGEYVYGMGEQFTPFVKNGQVVDIWNEDPGTSSELAYKNVPFYLTNHGYGVFVNHPGRVSFEVGSEKVERVQFSVPGENLEYYLIYGPTPKEVLERYATLTGRPALPPAWTFGLWLSTSFTTNYDEETVTGFVQGMADRDVPLHVLHYDCFWMKEFRWVDFEWDARVFPDPPGMLQRLKQRGLHICLWINSYIGQRSPLFEEGMKNGYLLKRPNGDVWQWDEWQAGMGLVDFTNPAACRWFAGKLRRLADMGVDCFKTDFGETIPTDVAYFDGSDPVRMHNYYAYLYNQVVFNVLEEKYGKGNAAVFARAATVGSQKFPIHWGGDSTATFESMAETLRGGLSMGMSGFGFWSHDIGGFEQTPKADVYKRWCAFGLLSSHSRLQGSTSYRVPWLFDEEAVDVLRFFTKLKCRLMPYLFNAAVIAHERGIPVMRPMPLEFPDERACDTLDRQYMLGDALLVAPVFTPDGWVDYYLPQGRWTNLISGHVVEGGRWLREQHGFLSLPVMVRPNSMLAFGAQDRRPDYDYADGVTFHVFEPQDGTVITTSVPTMEGKEDMSLTFTRSGQKMVFQPKGASKPWQVLVHGLAGVQSIQGGAAQNEKEGTRLISENQGSTIEITI